MKRILFVDDEPLVLEALRNALRKQRAVSEMSFLNSGEEALQALGSQPYDAVVTDMRMPGMDGAELLRLVRERHPGTARLVLTGQASNNDIVRAIPVAQQILLKPCDPPTLWAALDRIFKVQALLGNERLQALVGSIEHLPSFPTSYQLLSEATQREDVSIAEVTRIVESDPALSVTLLTMANSAYFGLSKSTTSIHTAVRHIGFQMLRYLALSSNTFSRMDCGLLSSDTLKSLPDRSLRRAQLARRLVRDRALADDAFAAGLLLDVGYIVLALGHVDSYLSILAFAQSSGRPIQEIEQERLGFTHAEVGAYLLGVWGLPAQLVDLVANHHSADWPVSSADPLGVAVHVANVWVDAQCAGHTDLPAVLTPVFRARCDVSAHLAEWTTLAERVEGAK